VGSEKVIGGHALDVFLTRKFPPGENIETTLILDYQQACETELNRFREGFIGIMDSRSGQILAAASKGGSPYFNHLLHGHYEPGSILKLVGLIAMAEVYRENLPARQYFCSGRVQFSQDYDISDPGHGLVNYLSATTGSCNCFYIVESWRVRDQILQVLERLGVMGSLHFQRFHVTKGIYEEKPLRSVAAMQHIGIGPVRLSAIHLLLLGAAIIEEGMMPSPASITNDPDFPPQPDKRQLFDPSVARFVRQAVLAAVEYGTGQAARIPGRTIGGKTGTVGHERDWAGFLALDFDRHVVVLVLLRTSRYGGEVAAPVAREILQAIR
jgi:peptidoglycan glycosyltransferase